MGMEVEAAIDGMDRERLEDHFRHEAARNAEEEIGEKVEEDLPETAEDQSEWNWLSLSKWVNVRYGLNTNDRELKKIGRDALAADLTRRALETLGRFDFSPLDVFTDEQFGRRSLCGWLHQQFTLETRPEEFENLAPENAVALVRSKIEELYRTKEIDFPVAVGMTNFMAEGPGGGGDRYNREGLIRWANDRFQASLPVENVKDRPRNEIESLLKESSRQFFVNGELVQKTDAYLEQAYPGRGKAPENGDIPENGEAGRQQSLGRADALGQRRIRTADRSASWSRWTTTRPVSTSCTPTTRAYRPELYQVELTLILEVLDTAWKDHLYYMDHLRSGIGLVGYAQLDPKVEYRREGRKTFPRDVGTRLPASDVGDFPHREGKPRLRWLAVADYGREPRRSHSHDERDRRTGAAGRDQPHRHRRGTDRQSPAEDRTERSVSVRQRQEIQEVLRIERGRRRFAHEGPGKAPACLGSSIWLTWPCWPPFRRFSCGGSHATSQSPLDAALDLRQFLGIPVPLLPSPPPRTERRGTRRPGQATCYGIHLGHARILIL